MQAVGKEIPPSGIIFDTGMNKPADALALAMLYTSKDPRLVAVSVSASNLKAAAFIVSQRNLIIEIDRIQEGEIFEKLSAAQVRVFQVSIADLTKLTKLDFGNLADVDSHEATSVGPRLIETFDDIRI